MHIIITAIGSAGDINPFITIGARLVDAGHRVDLIASPYFEEKTRRGGLNLLPLGTIEDYYAPLRDPDMWKLKTSFPAVWKLVMHAAELTYDLIERNYIADETLLIGSTLAIGARLAQEKLKIPFASVHLSPSIILSAYGAPQSATNPLPEWVPRIIKSLYFNAFERIIMDPVCKPLLNEIRTRLGMSSISHNVFSQWIHSPELVLLAFPEWYASVQPDWPSNSFNTNFPLYTADYDLTPSKELTEFLDSGKAPIVITAGTAMAFAKPFLEQGLKASKKTGNRLVIVCDFEDQVDKSLLDQSTLHIRYANFQTLFSRASLVIHHGGIGTSAMALSCGVPQLVAPFAHDQFDNAMRLERLGVAKMLRQKENLLEWCQSINYLQQPATASTAQEYKNKILIEKSGAEVIVDILNRHLIA